MQWIGIDVSKAHLDAACRPSENTAHFANGPEGHLALCCWLQQQGPCHVVLEPTGGYERARTKNPGCCPSQPLDRIDTCSPRRALPARVFSPDYVGALCIRWMRATGMLALSPTPPYEIPLTILSVDRADELSLQ